jgi:hypothetical protein
MAGFKAERVRDSERKEKCFARFNSAIKEITLSCPDASIDESGFRRKLDQFVKDVMNLRAAYTRDFIGKALEVAMTDPTYKGDVYPKMPPGIQLIEGREPEDPINGPQDDIDPKEE